MDITVRAKTHSATTGKLSIGKYIFDCTLGAHGLIAEAQKVEGDKKTPLGEYPLRYLLYRADRRTAPPTDLPLKILTPQTGWCEDPAHPDYNREITLPHAAVCDKMTRDDHLYDYTVVLGHNDSPPIAGKGSAIFMHLARHDFTPTAGCIGLKEADLLEVLKLCGRSSKIKIMFDE